MKSYLNRKTEELRNANIIIDGGVLEVAVYRVGTTGTRPGFEDSVATMTKVGTIKARIDRWKGKSFREIVSGMGEAIELVYVGVTTDTVIGVNDGDEWRVGGNIYKVAALDDTTDAKEVLLKRIV